MNDTNGWKSSRPWPATSALGTILLVLACGTSGEIAGNTINAQEDGPGDGERTGGWRLAATDSPYLRQHADNPVAWHPWGEEAFALAAERDVPVFLSIGYSSCHWCHVMEHESFEDAQTAAYLNEHFVSIKVDREQRPDVDARYMTAISAMTGSGGWPLTAFLTPEGSVFYGGTYFPPVSRGGRPSFLDVLNNVVKAWNDPDDRAGIDEYIQRTEPQLLADTLPKINADWDPDAALDAAASKLLESLDPVLGGVTSNRPPRFPPSMLLQFLMRHQLRTGSIDVSRLEVTLDAMASAGLRDHVAGGFHRYTVDSRWHAPHFEKMLYDNALLAATYAEAYALTGHERHANIARQTLAWLVADMRSPEGLYYSARDADSLPFDEAGRPAGTHAEEGLVYLWNREQLAAVLGEDDGLALAKLYKVTFKGNFEHGQSIMRPMRTDAELAADPGHELPTGAAFVAWLADMKSKLLVAREKRPQAFRDEKCLAAWNGLALTGFARCAKLLGDGDLANHTAALATALRRTLVTTVDGQTVVAHQLFEGRVSGTGDLADHAAVGRGLLDAYEVTGDVANLVAAVSLGQTLLKRFEDPDKGGFFATVGDDPLLKSRSRILNDNARPAGQSLALQLLGRLAAFDDSGRFFDAVERAVQPMGRALSSSPHSFPSLLTAVDAWRGPLAEVVLAGSGATHDQLLSAAHRRFLPAAVIVPDASAASAALTGALFEDEPSLLAGRRGDDGPTAWVCQRGVCLLPVQSAAALDAQWNTVIARP